jgi:hypothetical protein
MVAPTEGVPGGGLNSPAKGPGTSPVQPTGRKWYVDDIVVAAFSILGFGGAVFLPVRYGFDRIPPIQVSFLLATGLAALTYRYLGGIEGASFAIGALKLGGTLAALVGIALIINDKLVQQIPRDQVWYLDGRVVNEKKDAIDKLVDEDFTVFPAHVHADPMGDFHVEFIRDATTAGTDHTYLTVKHPGFGPVTIPLEIGHLKDLYPNAKVQDKLINIDRIVLPTDHIAAAASQGHDVSYPDSPPTLQPLSQGQLSQYKEAVQTARPADPISGGLPK